MHIHANLHMYPSTRSCIAVQGLRIYDKLQSSDSPLSQILSDHCTATSLDDLGVPASATELTGGGGDSANSVIFIKVGSVSPFPWE